MKVGLNTFSVLVTNISGTEVTGLSGSDFTMSGQVGADFYETADIETTVESITDGIYNFSVNILNPGQGHLKFNPVSSTLFVTPDYFDLEVSEQSIDDVYRTSNIRFLDIGVRTASQTYRNTTFNVKEGDDTILTIVTEEDLVGWTDFKSAFAYSTTEPISGANVIGNASIESVNTTSGEVVIKIPNTLTTGIVPSGKSNIVIYGDIDALDSASNRRTIAELRLTVRRDFAP